MVGRNTPLGLRAPRLSISTNRVQTWGYAGDHATALLLLLLFCFAVLALVYGLNRRPRSLGSAM
jgi:hypothetical protein